MAKVGYIMATSQYDKLEEDRKWMNEFGCVRIIEESDDNERHRPLWKQLMAALQRGDELVIPKFSNALRGSRELAIFLEFCRVKVIRIISIHDRIDSSNILFPETKPSDVLVMMGSLPDEVLALRKSAEHVIKLQEKMIVSLPPVSASKMQKLDREKTVVNRGILLQAAVGYRRARADRGGSHAGDGRLLRGGHSFPEGSRLQTHQARVPGGCAGGHRRRSEGAPGRGHLYRRHRREAE